MSADEKALVAAHQAGMAYYKRNPHATGDLGFVARSTGWHGELEQAWLAGFYGAKRRAQIERALSDLLQRGIIRREGNRYIINE